MGYTTDVLTAGTIVEGRYRVAELLGRGGMADVFRAVDRRTDLSVALKALRCADPTSTERFRSEVRALRRLHHPGVVALRGSGVHDDVPYLVLDLVNGPALDEELAEGPLGVERAVTIGHEVAAALAEAHRLAIVHRDVKPSNVLIDVEGHARLSDFGIARMLGTPSVTATGAVVGSPAYVAPEQLGGRPVGPAADVYALGLVVVECLTGVPCYTGPPSEAALARLHRPPIIPDDVPRWLQRVLAAMTARHADRRPDAGAIADAFEHQTAESVLPATAPIPLHPTAPAPAHLRRRRRSTWPSRIELVGAAVAATLLVGGLAIASAIGADDLTVTPPPPPPPTSTTTAVTDPAGDQVAEPTPVTPPPTADRSDNKGKKKGHGKG